MCQIVVPSLDSLSTELLVTIFKYLDIHDLCKLKQTCRRFNDIIETWGSSFIPNVKLLVTNQLDPSIINRSARLLPHFERLRISRNWKLGVYSEKSLLYTKSKFIPWVQLEREHLWVSRGGCIRAYKRNRKGIDPKHVAYSLKGRTRAEVCRFVVKNNHILSGQTDGSLRLWSKDSQTFIFDLQNCHEADINSVDMYQDTLVSGSRDNFVKIWKTPQCNQKIENETVDLCDRVWSVALPETRPSFLAIGTAGVSFMSTLTIFDLTKHKFVAKLGTERFGAGILDVKWDSDSILWTCGYDAHLRRWDLRTGNCEQDFDDPCGSVMYCFQYDHFNSIISGTQSNGRVVLWDTRQKNYIQMYFMECCRRHERSSPVYGLCYDAEFLFAVTDQHLSVLDFSVFDGKFRDYSNLFLKLIKV